MSGIVGGINLRSSGLVNISSASDGQVFTGTGAGLPVGFEAAAGGGKILQCLSVTKTDTYVSGSTTFTNITGLTLAITCAATSSKVLILGSVSGDGYAAYWIYVRIARDGTSIGHADAASNRPTVHSGSGGTNVGYSVITSAVNFLDSPSSTSELTYTFQTRNAYGDGVVYINRAGRHADNTVNDAVYTSTMTLLEIGA